MRPSSRNFILILVAFTAAALTTVVTLRGQGQSVGEGTPPDKQRQREEFERQFPVTDFDSQEPADPDKRNSRRKKSSRHDNSHFVNKGDATGGAVESVFFDERDFGLPAVPVSQSEAILVGSVVDAQAYLSNDKTGVYSEFNVAIEEALKNSASAPLAVKSIVSMEREGGAVRFPSKGKYLYRISGQGMPRVGKRYVFFLKASEPPQTFEIITAYELRGGKVIPLDSSQQFDAYKNVEEAVFLDGLRNAVERLGEEVK